MPAGRPVPDLHSRHCDPFSAMPGRPSAAPRAGPRKNVQVGAMKACFGFLLLCCAGFATAFAQEAPDINVFSFADTSCAEWARSQGNEQWRAIYGAWFRGFVSGYNFGNSGNQVPLDKMPDPAKLALYIDKFCRENPAQPFIGAAIPLVQEIREFRIGVPAPKQ